MLKQCRGRYTDHMVQQSANLVGAVGGAIKAIFNPEGKKYRPRKNAVKYRKYIEQFVFIFGNEKIFDVKEKSCFQVLLSFHLGR